MHIVEIIFWIALSIVFYVYIGYAMLLWIVTRFIPKKNIRSLTDDELPAISHLIAAYNEEDWIEEKINNCFASDYPKDKIQHIIIADGSTDRTADIVKKYSKMKYYFSSERKGKLAAVNRVFPLLDTDIVFFSDANAMLTPNAFRAMTKHFMCSQVGAVAGEKVVLTDAREAASGAGEAIYWRYESMLKYWDYRLHSVIGAAGELFAIRMSLYESPREHLLIEDFMISIKIAMNGHVVAYEPNAKAMETGSANIKEELKRKVRISAGGLQAFWELRALLNPFKYGLLSFQYVSHRALRWTLAPLSILVVLLTNIWLAYLGHFFFQLLLILQIAFYLMAFLGYLFERNRIRMQILFIPFYFTFMNLSIFLGLTKLIRGDYSVKWDRAERKKLIENNL